MPLNHFAPATLDELRSIISKYSIKCSPEDPLPATVMKKNLELLLPYWLDIVNLSLETGTIDGLKNAIIFPLLKEIGTDNNLLKNYRPVSNLQFISKLIERVVAARLDDHIGRNKLYSPNQFGYKKWHCTEHLLLAVVDKLLMNCDKGMPSVILLLDMSAAFDTVDHDKMLSTLRNIGITGVALEWFRSFLTGRSFCVQIGESISDFEQLLFGVAQGSVLGPRLFNIYVKPVYRDIEPLHFDIEGFADDHQLVQAFLSQLQYYALGDNIRRCLSVIGSWMNSHFLKLNESKTKIIVIAPPSVQSEIFIRGVFVTTECIRFSDIAKNLGLLIDSLLTFDSHISSLTSACFSFIRKLHAIKVYLSMDHLKSLICGNIFSRLDYCNALFYGLNASSISKLQRVQNDYIMVVFYKDDCT